MACSCVYVNGACQKQYQHKEHPRFLQESISLQQDYSCFSLYPSTVLTFWLFGTYIPLVWVSFEPANLQSNYFILCMVGICVGYCVAMACQVSVNTVSSGNCVKLCHKSETERKQMDVCSACVNNDSWNLLTC